MERRVFAVWMTICVLLAAIIQPACALNMVGDVNDDGNVNLKDVTFLRRYLENGDKEITIDHEQADVNGDGTLDSNDVIFLMKYLAGGWGITLPGSSDNAAIDEDLAAYTVLETSQSANGVNCTAFSYGTSELGRDLVCWSICQADYTRTILLNFEIHGWEDSYAADGQLLADLGNTLVEYYAESANLEDCRLIIIPSANPDGLAEGTTNNGFGRCNAKGIDLNRDFDANHVAYTSDRNYTPYPFSAAESRAMRDLVLSTAPEVVIDFHGWLDYTIGSSDLAEVFSLNVGVNHYKELTSSASGYFSYWAQLQGAEALLVEFTNTASIVPTDVIHAVDQILSNNYGSKQSNYELDGRFEKFDKIDCYALTSGKVYTQSSVGNSGTSYGYIDGASDKCTIRQIYSNGWCKVNYPVGNCVKTGYCEISAFIDPAAEVEHYSAQVSETVKVYSTPNCSTQIGSVWNSDTFTVVAEEGGMAQIIYPLDSGGYKMGWIDASAISGD